MILEVLCGCGFVRSAKENFVSALFGKFSDAGADGPGGDMLRLHDLNSPSRVVLVDAEDISIILAMPTGSAILMKDVANPIYVHESTDEIATLEEEPNA